MPVVKRLPDGSEMLVSLAYSVREMQGVTVLVVVSCVSLVAIVGLLLAISLSAYNTRSSLNQHLFVRTHVAAYFLSLLLCNLLQAIGSIANATWIGHMGVHVGQMCVLQGVLKQASDIGIALWTLVIAIHTFCLLFLELKTRTFVLWTTLFGGWSAIAALVILGPATLNTDKRGPFFGISGYWCWISPQYKIERITLDYMVMFLAALISFVLYILLFLRLRGNIVRNGWRICFRRTNEAGAANWHGHKFADDHAMAIAKQMLLYPVAYTALVLPIAVSRFSSWTGHNVPFEVTIFTAAIFLLSGLVNVVLFTTTRRILPIESMRIGQWTLSRPPGIPPAADDQGGAPYIQTSQPTTHSRTNSQSSDSTIVAHSNSYTIPRKDKPRPPDIIIRRESLDSVYSVYDEELPDVPGGVLQPPVTSHWSPDGSPQRRSWKFLAALKLFPEAHTDTK